MTGRVCGVWPRSLIEEQCNVGQWKPISSLFVSNLIPEDEVTRKCQYILAYCVASQEGVL